MDSCGAAGLLLDRRTVDAAAWHLWIDRQPRPGYINMSVDLALLDRTERAGESWLRLYQWAPHCLSFGRHEPAARRYDRRRIERLGLDTVRRPTGGRAVWHAAELTYAVCAPLDRFVSAGAAYLEIHQMIRDALGSIAVYGSIAQPRRSAGLAAGACFSHPAGGEVLVGGRKVVGSAQLRRHSCFLQHGSILLQGTQSLVDDLRCDSEVPAKSPADTMAAPLGRPVPPAELADAVAGTAAGRWSGLASVRRPDEVLVAAARYFPRFQSAAWTWTR